MGITLVLLVARVGSGLFEASHPSTPSSLVKWVPMEQAEALARERRLPIFYDYSADWCMPCRLLNEQVFLNHDAAQDINTRYISVRVVNTEDEQGANTPEVDAFIKKYKAQGLPTLVIVTPDGELVDKTYGYPGFTDTLRFLRLPSAMNP